MDGYLFILNQTKLLGYRCKSGIAIFAWRFTWNYAVQSFFYFNLNSFKLKGMQIWSVEEKS